MSLSHCGSAGGRVELSPLGSKKHRKEVRDRVGGGVGETANERSNHPGSVADVAVPLKPLSDSRPAIPA